MCLAKVVNVLAIRQVKQGPGTNRFRIGFTRHSCQYNSSSFNSWLDSGHKITRLFSLIISDRIQYSPIF